MWTIEVSICLPKIIRMDKCIVNIVEGMAFIAFAEIVEIGSITIWQAGNTEPVFEKEVNHSNFENVDLDFDKGIYKLEIVMNNQKIQKSIKIK